MNAATKRKGVHASAVGHGIAHAIYAATSPPMTVDEWVIFCSSAADEAEATVREAPPPTKESSARRLLRELSEPGDPEFDEAPEIDEAALRDAMREAGATAFRSCMPKLTGRRNTQAYIACVAVGVQRGYFNGSEAKALLYTTQLALSAHPHRRVNRGRKPQ